MGRFTFDMLLDFEGLSRVLTVVARGYMWESEEPDVEQSSRALRAWCSVPDSKKASPKEDWRYRSEFSDLHREFPELVDEQETGWLCRHVLSICDFVKVNPDVTNKPPSQKRRSDVSTEAVQLLFRYCYTIYRISRPRRLRQQGCRDWLPLRKRRQGLRRNPRGRSFHCRVL